MLTYSIFLLLPLPMSSHSAGGAVTWCQADLPVRTSSSWRRRMPLMDLVAGLLLGSVVALQAMGREEGSLLGPSLGCC